MAAVKQANYDKTQFGNFIEKTMSIETGKAFLSAKELPSLLRHKFIRPVLVFWITMDSSIKLISTSLGWTGLETSFTK
jgi:hypothetical protein